APLNLNRSGKSPVREFLSLLEVIKLYKVEKPDIVHHVALKPVLYGAIAATLSRTPATINALAGLGHIFIAEGIRARLVRMVIKAALRLALRRKSATTIFENPDDLNLFVKMGLVKEKKAILIKSVGVDTSLFAPPTQEPSDDDVPIVLLSSRMLETKGIGDFVKAAQILKKRGANVRMVLVGSPDPHNPASIPLSQLEQWNEDGIIEYWGFKDDMVEILKSASIVVLPSFYGEGVPRSLMEAASAGKPIVTYDVPGCREIARNDINGFLVPLRDIDALAKAIFLLVDDSDLRKKMGQAGREIVKDEFSETLVNAKTMKLYYKAIGR
ncbi:Lipid carrier : UDP-N-acetylgalactosaminyltransferase / Alpha-1,3-N-acetylgalactosamine transferase PglA; Putative glycosyltransferase, partial [hydrothermal vent metagenome]